MDAFRSMEGIIFVIRFETVLLILLLLSLLCMLQLAYLIL